MQRDIAILRNGVVVWSGRVGDAERHDVRSASDYMQEAWRRALAERAVTEVDAGEVQFRFASRRPDAADEN